MDTSASQLELLGFRQISREFLKGLAALKFRVASCLVGLANRKTASNQHGSLGTKSSDFACTETYMYTHIYIYININIYIYIHIYIYMYIYIYIYMFVCMYVCTHVCMYVCMKISRQPCLSSLLQPCLSPAYLTSFVD